MCGIAGRIDFVGEAVDKALLASAGAEMRLRGPDDEGMWQEGPAGFVHRRLAVIDLTDAGHQPMLSRNGRYVCVFNGEIYNFRALRDELNSDQGAWVGNSDTEVLLAAYAVWGTNCLDRLDGMFAFAIWDRQSHKLFAARDRLGEKPFYYHWDGRRFAFASRPQALFALLPGLSREYDAQALRLYLESGYFPAPYSAHAKLRKLPAAHTLTISSDGIEICRYWDLRKIEPCVAWEGRKLDDLVDELEEIVSRSVAQRMVGDVPLGGFLSGGIDSSLVVAMMRRHSSGPIKTFTIGFDEPRYDESPVAAAIAAHLGTDHHCQRLRADDLLALVPEFFTHFDEPFFDSSAFPTMAVSRLARQHVTVSLTGDGGDELFGGYHYYRIARALAPIYELPDWLRQGIAGVTDLGHSHRGRLLGAALRKSSSASAFAFGRSIAKDFRGVLPADAIVGTVGLEDLFCSETTNFPKKLVASEQGMRLDALYTLAEDYLQKTDLASMAYSLEARAPLLGKEVVEWGMRLPAKWKVRWRTNKFLLRHLAYRHVPKRILDLPKRGFGVPIDAWLRGPLSGWAEERFRNPDYFVGLPIDQDACLELFRLHQSGFRNVHPLIWAILMLLEFNVRFIAKK
jgi:asparagine synthase (glutamine-hydrolysing)